MQTQAWKGVVLRQTGTKAATHSGSNSNLNNIPDDVLKPSIKNNGIECSILGQNTKTNAKTMAIQISTIDQITPLTEQ